MGVGIGGILGLWRAIRARVGRAGGLFRYGARRGLCNRSLAFLVLCGLCWGIALPKGAVAQTIRVAMLGDSLTAGYGLAPQEGLVAQLQAWLIAQGRGDVSVLNAGVSGDTSAGGLARLGWTLADGVDGLIVALGGNDMLRGIEPGNTRANLGQIVQQAQAQGVSVLLVGMQAPGNFGLDYKAAFDAIYPDLAAQYGVALMPGFFSALLQPGQGPGDILSLLQADGIHPNAIATGQIAAALGPYVLALASEAAR